MKSTLPLIALLTASTLTACVAPASDELGATEMALRGVEPDVIDVAADDSDDGTAITGVEPDEIDVAADDSDDGTAITGVEPDEIDVAVDDCEPAVRGVEPDEIDVECESTTQPGVEPDEIDAHASGDGSAGKPRKLVTYGPVITIKPKG